ncbi:hypothetical protein QL285_044677 [Trifolium repens]|nr:hypothetical protein QL285_044677 [Trifolium repens]
MLIRRCNVKSRQKLHIRGYVIRSYVMNTSCSDACSEGRFVRRTFSATIIEFHHLLTTQKWRINLILRIVTLVLLYEPFTRIGQIFIPKFGRTQKLPDMVQDRTITSWRNLLQRIQIQDAPPSTINRSGSEVLCTIQLNNLKELLLCKNHPVHKTT